MPNMPPQLEKETTNSFNSLIRKMMHSFGDTKTPHPDSAKLIEDIVQQQMRVLLEEAETIALTRGSSSVGMEEFIFLLRHDLNKLAKLVRFLHFKDIKTKLKSSSITNKENATSSETSENNDGTAFSIQNSLASSVDPATAKPETFGVSSAAVDKEQATRRVRLCYDFLQAIDTPLGRYSVLFTESFYPDAITRARMHRLFNFTERMTVREYLYYQHCRSVSFAGVNASRFKEWVQELSEDKAENGEVKVEDEEKLEEDEEDETKKKRLKLDRFGLEVMQHLAHETVAALVELALLVKSEEQEAAAAKEWTSAAAAGQEGTQRSELLLSTAPENTAYIGRDMPAPPSTAVPLSKTTSALEAVEKGNARFYASFGARVGSWTSPREGRIAAGCRPTSSSTTTSRRPWAKSILPVHIFEAMRRFEARPTVFERWTRRSTPRSARMKLLCL